MITVLGIETSCDETSVGILRFSTTIRERSRIPDVKELSLVILSQEVHSKYGGVVPELASRSHLESILPVLEQALDKANVTLKDIDLIAVTNGPGLPGSLVVGVNFAKGLSQAMSKKIIMVNHVEAHMLSPLIENDIAFPFFSLIASGGHTSLYLVKALGDYELLLKTQDDAAGEAFDKIAKIFRLPYPGGPIIDSIAKDKEPIFSFPKVEAEDFSFSGLKTFCLRASKRWFGPFPLPEFLSSAQKKIVEELIEKTLKKVAEKIHLVYDPVYVAIGGGVARNSYMRKLLERDFKVNGNSVRFIFPSHKYCIDNGSMVAFLGGLKYILLGKVSDIKDEIVPTYQLKHVGGLKFDEST